MTIQRTLTPAVLLVAAVTLVGCAGTKAAPGPDASSPAGAGSSAVASPSSTPSVTASPNSSDSASAAPSSTHSAATTPSSAKPSLVTTELATDSPTPRPTGLMPVLATAQVPALCGSPAGRMVNHGHGKVRVVMDNDRARPVMADLSGDGSPEIISVLACQGEQVGRTLLVSRIADGGLVATWDARKVDPTAWINGLADDGDAALVTFQSGQKVRVYLTGSKLEVTQVG